MYRLTNITARLSRPKRRPDGMSPLTAAGVSAALAVLLLAGCASVGPNYVPPDTKAPSSWSGASGQAVTSVTAEADDLADWWERFDDPVLTGLVKRAVEGNLDIQTAESRIREARAQRGMTASQYLPSVKASGSASASRSEKDGDVVTNDSYKAGFDASWELDIFGGTRRSVEAAEAEVQASEENLRDVLVTVTAEVVLNYIDVRSYQTRLSIAEKNLELQTATLDIVKWRNKAGLVTQLDVEQASYAVEQTRAGIPSLKTGLAAAENRLAVLLGQNPSALSGLLAERGDIPVVPVSVAVGVPADVLRRRPDIRQAERRLAAQTAQVGAAVANRYPSFSLGGSTGLESLDLADLFSGSWISSAVSSVGYTVFDAGRLKRAVEVQTELQAQALASYESTVLSALEEVENALTAFAGEQERREALSRAAQSAQTAVELVTIQYNSGQKDFQVLLEAQRSLLNYQDQLASSGGAIASDLIRLYKALGGEWTTMTPVAVQ